MARYCLSFVSKTMAPLADAGTATDNAYATVLAGNSATMRLSINEVYIGGESTSSSPTVMCLRRDSTKAVTLTGNFNALMDVQATAPGTVALFGSASSTKPVPSTTHLITPSLNAYGGIARWQARYGEEITVATATAPECEVSLSAITGTGIVSGHILYEVV
jgi:hypothetical protein